jgi:hypothetical protein
MNIVEAHLVSTEGIDPPPRRIVVCDWGCCNGSAIDCTSPEGEMVFIRDDGADIHEGISFRQWMTDWASGVDLWERAYGSNP